VVAGRKHRNTAKHQFEIGFGVAQRPLRVRERLARRCDWRETPPQPAAGTARYHCARIGMVCAFAAKSNAG